MGGDSSQTRRVNPGLTLLVCYSIGRGNEHCSLQRLKALYDLRSFALTQHSRTNTQTLFLVRDWIFRGTVIASNSARFYGVEKPPNPETSADSRGILGDFREFDESNGTRPLPAFNASNFIDSRNITIRCYISIMELCITVFWYKCVILWDICFIISLLKC